MRYKKEIEFLQSINELIDPSGIVPKEKIDNIISEYPNAPLEFIDFLQEIGGNDFKNAQFEIKGFLFTLSDIGLEDVYEISDDIVFFGDNHMGDLVGFDLSKELPTVAELDHTSGEIYDTNQSFREFLHEQIGIRK